MNYEDYTEEELYVFMSFIPGFGCVSQHKLLEMCQGVRGAFLADGADIGGMTYREARELPGFAKAFNAFVKGKEDETVMEKALEVLGRCRELGISVVTAGDEAYPRRFKGRLEMPIVLYTKGELRINEFDRAIGVIGARRCSREGRAAAIEISEAAGRSKVAVVSGMAKGVDSYANTGCIRTGGYTAAVLGSGPDICYPKENLPLYEAIIETGCIISEYPPGTEVRPYAFPARNRIIAALSDELYAIEVGEKSGSMTTVEWGKRYGVPVTMVG
ncbi:DNA-protecting protein DprA [Butyrivibrio sp. DSM 10294]|uniref:DNA-protecting protein DprA n=1 Tax=Butyrivibrio sp. DSM 10294 TaxID=2972457 RepID=UPI00234EB624|nr:DNA-protecting protein DprA [Butyrivibrio sp. DSM 10294]MDC7292998.1 DNA-protecting protein DprA [Butyrivibrio sp. DSM 10294]